MERKGRALARNLNHDAGALGRGAIPTMQVAVRVVGADALPPGNQCAPDIVPKPGR
jgi:hypothetical protein